MFSVVGSGTAPLDWAANDRPGVLLVLHGADPLALPGVVVANAHRTPRPSSARSTSRWLPQSWPSLEQGYRDPHPEVAATRARNETQHAIQLRMPIHIRC